MGRAEELARLEDALGRTGRGVAAGVFVGGEAGIGKTRLVGAFAEHAAAAGARVLTGACAPTGGVSYEPMFQALRPLTHELPEPLLDWLVGDGRAELSLLLPELGAAAGPSALTSAGHFRQHRLFAHVLGLLERLASEEPVVLVVEDLHWADDSTRELLRFLARNLEDAPVVLVGTYRTEHLRRGDPLRGLLLELDRTGRVDRFELPRFDRDEVTELLTRILGVPPAEGVTEEISARAQGNPLFCEELLAAMRTGTARLPPTLRDVLLHRVDELSDAGRHVLSIASVLGPRLDRRFLAAVADLDEEALLAGERETVDHQLLVPEADGRSYAFRHALLAEAVYEELPAGDRLRWHAAIADILETRPELALGDPTAAQAYHWDAAGDAEKALPAHVEAGTRAESMYGFAEAARHFARAAALWTEVHAPEALVSQDRVGLLERAGHAAHVSGDHREAIRLLTEARGEADPLRVALIDGQRGTIRSAAGDSETGTREVLDALAHLPPDAPARARADLLATAGTALQRSGRNDEARRCCEQAIDLAEELEASAIEARARNSLASALADRGETDEGIAHLHRARALAENADDIEELLRAYLNLQALLANAGRREEAVAVGRDGIEVVTRLGLAGWQSEFLHGNHAGVLFALGRWQEARDALDRIPAAAEGVAGLQAELIRADMEAAQGDVEAAERALAAARRKAQPEAAYYASVAELEVTRGNPGAAWEVVREAVDADRPLEASAYTPMPACLIWLGIRAAADRVEAAEALRRRDEAAEQRAAAEALFAHLEQLDSSALATVVAFRSLAAAELTRARGHPDPHAWAEAAGQWEAFGNVYRPAYARWREAEAVAAAHGPRAQIAELLGPAHAAACRLGAVPLREAIERLAAHTRVPLPDEAGGGDGEPAADDPIGDLGLTDREHEVLLLLAEGHRNQEIGAALHIAEKTASVHVSNILRKLGVASRSEAAVVAHRLGLLDRGAGSATPAP